VPPLHPIRSVFLLYLPKGISELQSLIVFSLDFVRLCLLLFKCRERTKYLFKLLTVPRRMFKEWNAQCSNSAFFKGAGLALGWIIPSIHRTSRCHLSLQSLLQLKHNKQPKKQRFPDVLSGQSHSHLRITVAKSIFKKFKLSLRGSRSYFYAWVCTCLSGAWGVGELFGGKEELWGDNTCLYDTCSNQ
jgi:hypothetical protein